MSKYRNWRGRHRTRRTWSSCREKACAKDLELHAKSSINAMAIVINGLLLLYVLFLSIIIIIPFWLQAASGGHFQMLLTIYEELVLLENACIQMR